MTAQQHIPYRPLLRIKTCLESTHTHLSITRFIILSPAVRNKVPLFNMRSQIILALLATAISAAPALLSDAKVCPLSLQPAAPTDAVILIHSPQNSQLSKREAGAMDILETSVSIAVLFLGRLL